MEERLLLSQLVAVADRAPDDTPQHVAAAVARRDDAVDQQERARADVIGDDPQARREVILRPRLAHRGADQLLKQVDLVIAVNVLQHRGEAFEPHPGIDARRGQRRKRAIRVAIELHENEIPDLDVTVALRFGRSGRAAPDFGTMIVEDLGARPAWAGIGHLPEIVARVLGALVVADAHAALRRHSDVLRPEIVGFVVVDVDGRPQFFGPQPVLLRQKVPREPDRVALEVVAEGPVAEHLEKRVVARGIADVFEVVVLAAGAQATLHRRCANVGSLLDAEEHVLELDHARVREQQRRIIGRDKRRARDDRVPALLEIFEEPAAYFVGFHARGNSVGRRRATAAARQSR